LAILAAAVVGSALDSLRLPLGVTLALALLAGLGVRWVIEWVARRNGA
jgi:hypothetical protein